MSSPKYEKKGSRTIHLIEECAELIHILSKAHRFGMLAYHPDDLSKTSNYELILREIEDVEKRIKEFKEWTELFKAQLEEIFK